MKRRARALILVAVLGPAGAAEARSFRVQQIPNGGVFQCTSCHTDNQASSFTNFGSNARSHLQEGVAIQTAAVLWDELCPLDSDNDGKTNGEELGDPNCTWSSGATAQTNALTNPGVPNGGANQCANGKLDSNEECDSPELLTFPKCVDVHAGAGQLGCTPSCTFDYSDCSNPPDGQPSGPVEESDDEGCSVARPPSGTSPALGALLGAVALVGLRARRRARRERLATDLRGRTAD